MQRLKGSCGSAGAMIKWSYAFFTFSFGAMVPASFVFAFCNLLVNEALSLAFGERARLKIGGKY